MLCSMITNDSQLLRSSCPMNGLNLFFEDPPEKDRTAQEQNLRTLLGHRLAVRHHDNGSPDAQGSALVVLGDYPR